MTGVGSLSSVRSTITLVKKIFSTYLILHAKLVFPSACIGKTYQLLLSEACKTTKLQIFFMVKVQMITDLIDSDVYFSN